MHPLRIYTYAVAVIDWRLRTLEHLARAAAADVAKGTLYNHFPVKEAVLAYWLHLELAEEGALHVHDRSAGWCESHPACLAPYLRFRFLGIGTEPSPSRDSERLSDIAALFDWLIRRGQRAGELRDDLDPARLAVAFHHLYLGSMLRWLAAPSLVLREEFAAAVELFLDGAAA